MKHIVFIPDIGPSNDFVNVLRNYNVPFHLIGRSDWYSERLSIDAISQIWLDPDDFNVDKISNAILKIKNDFHLSLSDIHLIGLRERSIELIGAVTTKVGCSGINQEMAELFRDKWCMVNRARNLGIKTPTTILADQIWPEQEFPQHGVILKPRMGLNSRDVFYYLTYEELKDKLSCLDNPSNYILQNFIPGSMFFLNSVVNRGKTQMLCIGKYLTPLMTAGRAPRSYMKNWIATEADAIHEKLFVRLRTQHDRIIQGFNLLSGCTHSEFFYTPDDQLVFCEIAARPPGSRIIAMERHLLKGKTTFELWARSLCENSIEPYDSADGFFGMISYTPEKKAKNYKSIISANNPSIIYKEEWPASEVKGGDYTSPLANIFIKSANSSACETILNELDSWFEYEV